MASEKNIENAIIRFYCHHGWSAVHVEPDGIFIPKGWPDIMALGPVGRVLFIEVKDPSDPTPDPIQKEIHARLRVLGHRVIIATNLDEGIMPLLEEKSEQHG